MLPLERFKYTCMYKFFVYRKRGRDPVAALHEEQERESQEQTQVLLQEHPGGARSQSVSTFMINAELLRILIKKI